MNPDNWKKIDELLDQALDLPPDRHSAFLDEACGNDSELRRELESLLAAHQKAGSFIETTPGEGMAAVLAEQVLDPPPPELIGRTLGHYEIISMIGAGGMGDVYKALDTKLDRRVAIKVLPQHLSSIPDALARFEREAKAVAALSHPNIMAIHDFGHEGGTAYAVMELLEGETLRARLTHSALGWREAVKIAASIADGLAAAHARGIIHRDIKPENVFLTSDGLVKVLDFGIARVKKAAVSTADTLISMGASETKPGTLMGTIGYMSPEQVRGESADAPSDIFSLGCMLVEMLTGERPFARPSAAETLASILRDEPPPLEDQTQDMPPELEKIIRRCLEKSPEERFQSARDLALDLRSLLTNSSGAYKPVSGAMPAWQPQQSELRKRSKWLIPIAIIISAILVIVAARSLFRSPDPRRNSVAILPFVNSNGNPNTSYLSDGIPESITNSLAEVPQLRVMGWSTVRYKTQTQKVDDPQKIGRELNVYAVVLGKVMQQGDNLSVTVEMIDVSDGTQLWGKRYDVKLADARNVQSEIAKNIYENMPVKLTGEQQQQLFIRYTFNTDAYQAYLQGRYFLNQRSNDWDENLKKAINYFKSATGKDDKFALAYAGLAEAYALLEDNSRNAIAAANRALELNPKLAEPRATIAFALFQYDWNWPEAEKGFLQAIQLNPRYATTHHWYAEFLTTQGRFDEAIKEINLATEIEPLSIPITVDLGIYQFFARRYDSAIAQLRKTLEFDPNNEKALSFLVAAYEQKREYSQTVATYIELARKQRKPEEDIRELQQSFERSGITGYWRKRLDFTSRSGKVTAPILASYFHAFLGEKDQAFNLLESAYAVHHFGLVYLKVDPRYDNLRGDPRFADLQKQVGF